MASRSLNKATLIGNLTRDPEVRYTPQGTAVAQFGVATNRDWVTAQGEKKEEVQYHRIVAWSKLAELCKQLLVKGSKVYVEGRIVYRQFDGKDGVQRNITEIVMDNMIVLSPGKGRGTAMSQDESISHSSDSAEETPEEDTDKKGGNKQESVDDSEIPF
ncbi:single-stranded DNA-binding protein [Candidatus Roizmanbacteria bacterium CG10_big_fil_rev_8_21_14_0_10_45_7]|uniref:Single-stranded DNA-binding protein n=1 Tax=Candidatus Roizmanbacteria bacterium CG10_big_fil_rev_8_21_14_0_10_45_7 TaxID=1974854 RepID=A0A2M8KU31_9BACT|nr:MAG: single-stranded DNA-binding protein [Candidatus Roizmanbacteria bacterium CG10_big_fil_rev_8_21_14_0_10_45_7]